MFSFRDLLVPATALVVGVFGASDANAENAGCYNLQSLQGSYGVVNMYGDYTALGLQAESLDGKGNLTRTGILNQPTAGSTTGQRTAGTVISNGTYTVNCNGTGTITRLVTRPDGSTATAADDFLITKGVEKDGQLIATAFVDVQRDPSVILPGGVFLTRTHTRRPSSDSTACYTNESLLGSYGVANMYGAYIALGIQAESLDGLGNLTRTGVLNQPTAGSTTGARTVGTVTSNGTYTVNCNGTGTITRLVTRPDGTTASASDDFLITEATEKDGRLIATTVIDVQRDPSVILPGGVFLTRTHTLRSNPTAQLEGQLQNMACGTNPPAPSCEASVSVWNYFLGQVNSDARPLVIGEGTQMMTVQKYFFTRASAGL